MQMWSFLIVFWQLNTRHILVQPPANIDVYKHSFFPDAIRLWNNLPSSITHADSVDNFKLYLKSFLHHLQLKYIAYNADYCTILTHVSFTITILYYYYIPIKRKQSLTEKFSNFDSLVDYIDVAPAKALAPVDIADVVRLARC